MMKYAHVLCADCLARVTKYNKREARKRKAAGKRPGGRPPADIDPRVIARYCAGDISLAQAAAKLGVTGNTVRRYARVQKRLIEKAYLKDPHP